MDVYRFLQSCCSRFKLVPAVTESEEEKETRKPLNNTKEESATVKPSETKPSKLEPLLAFARSIFDTEVLGDPIFWPITGAVMAMSAGFPHALFFLPAFSDQVRILASYDSS